jgi:hypothetical protein
VIRRLRHIIIGWGKRWGFLPTSKAEEKLAQIRMDICEKCPFSKESKLLILLNGEAEFQNTLSCTKCGCPCAPKTIVVDETCPVKNW